MIPLLLKFIISGRVKYNLAHLSLCIFLFISSVLLLCLTLACHNSASALSGIFLIEAGGTNQTVTRTGYFSMCSKSQANGTFGCSTLGSFKDDGELAYVFAKHVSRPYFLCISLAVTIAALIYAIVRIFVKKIGDYFLPWLVITFIFCMVAAVWQQVAVQAATHLIANTMERGDRAGAMIWSAFAFNILALLLDLFLLERNDDEDYEDINKSGEHSVISTIYKIGEGVNSI